jgi:hypothetical protein
VNALIKRGSILIQQEKQTDGLDDFAKAVRLDPDNPDVYHHRGHVSLQRSCKFTKVILVYNGQCHESLQMGDFQKNEDFSFSENNLNIK